jgi:hypothetical protein
METHLTKGTMALVTTHGVIGAGIRAASAKAVGVSDEWCLWLAIIGAVEGMAPDAFDWLAWYVFGCDRWVLYRKMHVDWKWFGLIFWGWGAHVLFDIPFHKNPGESWFARLWWLEFAGLAFGALLLWWTFWG